MSGEGFDGEVHILFDLRREFHRIRSRHPHSFVQRDADTVRELLQRHGSYLSSSYSGNAATTSAVVLPGRSFSRPAYIESYTSLYKSISFCVFFTLCAPP